MLRVVVPLVMSRAGTPAGNGFGLLGRAYVIMGMPVYETGRSRCSMGPDSKLICLAVRPIRLTTPAHHAADRPVSSRLSARKRFRAAAS